MLLKRHVAGYSLAGSSRLMEFDNGSGEDELAQLLDAVVGEKCPNRSWRWPSCTRGLCGRLADLARRNNR